MPIDQLKASYNRQGEEDDLAEEDKEASSSPDSATDSEEGNVFVPYSHAMRRNQLKDIKGAAM